MKKELETTLTQNLVFAGTEFGIAVVQELAAQAIAQKPGMTLRDFTHILDGYIENAKKQVPIDLANRK
jgi:hypothetical protein